MTRLSDDEAFSSEGPQCPHCLFILTPDEDFYFDPIFYDNDECPECGQLFKVRVYTETTWTSLKCDAAP
jgi:hypothetical protein